MSQAQDYYRILGVSRDALDREIKKKYYELARELHPDKASSPEEADQNARKLATMTEAYNTLKDAAKRAEYDKTLRGRPAGAATASAAPSAPAKPNSPGGGGAAAPPEPARSSSASVSTSQVSSGGSNSASQTEQKKKMAQKAFIKGLQHLKNQEHKEALPFFEAAVKNDPESDSQYHIKYAQALIKTKGSFTKAVEHATIATEMDPYSTEYKIILGDIYETAGVKSKAIEVYQDVLRWDKENQYAKLRLGLLGIAIPGQKKRKDNGILAKIFPSLFNK
ncbi:MAG: DnaJ domain-containing protein [Sumerlaeia bacterium]